MSELEASFRRHSDRLRGAAVRVPQYSLTILIEALIFGLFAMSLDLLVGYCRLYSFGHAAAYGLGAYSYALILTHLPLPLPMGLCWRWRSRS